MNEKVMSYEKQNAELARHKIAGVKFKQFKARYPRLHGKNAIKGYHGFGNFVTVAEITTDKGATGWGALMRKRDSVQPDAIIGKAVTDIFAAETGILSAEYEGFDIALHDLAGNILGLPVCKIVNPDAALEARVYDGAIYMNDIIPEDKPFGVDKVIEEAVYDYALGHRMLKIKIGRGNMWMEPALGLERDIEIVTKIHEALPDAVIMVDGNDGFTFETMVKFLEGIGSCPIYWIEEPFREEENNNRKLREYLRRYRPQTYIADGESFTDIDLLFSLADKGLLDIWQPDICGYGFTAWRTLLKKLADKGYLSSPHAWGDVIKTHYCAQLEAAYPFHVPCVEAVLGDSEGVDYSGYTLSNGVLTLPDKPGFGMDLVWAPEV